MEEKDLDDLQIARLRLKKRGLTLVIVKEGRILYETGSHGVIGLLQAIERFADDSFPWGGDSLSVSSVADVIVGRAAALLCVYFGASSVFALTISEEGIEVLEDNGIRVQFENRVRNVLNVKKNDKCPLEKLLACVTDPKEAYEKIRAFTGFR